MLSFTLSDQTISKLRELSQSASHRQLLLGQLAPAERDYIHRNVRISMIGASTRIENAVLTDAEVDWLDTVLTKNSHLTARKRCVFSPSFEIHQLQLGKFKHAVYAGLRANERTAHFDAHHFAALETLPSFFATPSFFRISSIKHQPVSDD
jgi:hypothetical protein